MGYALFAQDVVAFIEALGLAQPLLCGISDGGAVATLVSLLAPTVPRAVVNWAGVSRFNSDPDAALYRSLRAFLGGSPDATRTNYDALVQGHPEFDLRLREADYEPAQGRGYVRTYLERAFAFATKPVGYALADFGRISAPTLVLVGDRDGLCSVAESAAAFQHLPRGELGVIPGAGHTITRTGCIMALDFLLRHRASFK
jgi:pimeloyl-ACP methyl ester carboxylesterase